QKLQWASKARPYGRRHWHNRCTPSHWNLQQVRFKKRGMEYQPKFLKRLRTHGWQTRIRTRGGIEVILRRMLKGRKSLSH
uniref:Large ribosomal subunit protein bL34m n=1 Tax=Leptobrachium leishanense TaxID=445787 RepID=A0A8C5LHG7_9ANUR